MKRSGHANSLSLCPPCPLWLKRPRRGFTFVELMVVVGILGLLLSIFVPYLMKVRESNNRVQCAENLRKIGIALGMYAKDNKGAFPRGRYDHQNRPNGYTAFTGADAGDPFGVQSEVELNDVTASLWLLVRGGYVPAEYSPASAVFVCPSSSSSPDPLRNAAGQSVPPLRRGNFRGTEHLSYSYGSPFSNATEYGMVDFLPHGFALAADMNPGVSPTEESYPAYDAAPLDLARANSRNHGGAGQNVLFSEGNVAFVTTPYCGIGGDNIYTALAPSPIFTGIQPDLKARGFAGRDVGPAWKTDSYLIPSEADAFPQAPEPTSQPAPAQSGNPLQ